MFSPVNRILIEHFELNGSFLITGGILLNLVACGLVIRPVPIEPAEQAKQKKRAIRMQIMQAKPKPNNSRPKEKPQFEVDDENNEQIDKPERLPFKSLLDLNGMEAANKINPKRLQRKFSYSADQLQIPMYRAKEKLSISSSLNVMALVKGSQSIRLGELDRQTSRHSNAADEIVYGEEDSPKKSFKETLKSFIDFSLFYDLVFMFFAASNFLTSLGFNAPYIFIVDQAISLGIEKHKADLLLSTIGISNTFGRIIIGYLGGLRKINRLYLYGTVLTLCGIATTIEPFATGFVGMMAYAITFGVTSGQ